MVKALAVFCLMVFTIFVIELLMVPVLVISTKYKLQVQSSLLGKTLNDVHRLKYAALYRQSG